MGFLRTYRFVLLAFLILSIVYFVTRFIAITDVPIFTDEAIYTRWAQIALNDPNWRFISLIDGKAPLFIWLDVVMMKFIQDPLLAGRVVSVLAGFGTMVGFFFLGNELFKNKWIGILSTLLYVVSPFALVYDRMALYDGLVGTFAVWGLYLVVLFTRYVRLDIALITGMVAGVSVLNKSNGFFTLYLLPFSLLLFDWSKKRRQQRFLVWVGLALVTAVLTYTIYNILRLSPLFYMIDQKNTTFLYTFSEWIKDPFMVVYGNLRWGLLPWVITYMTPPLVLLMIASFFIDKKFLPEKLVLLIWFAFPLIALGFFGKVIYPRYAFPMYLSLLPLVAYTLFVLSQKITSKLIIAALCVLFFAWPVYSQAKIITHFATAPIPDLDLDQYIRAWPSGGGVKEATAFFVQEARKGKITIATEGTFGLMPYAFEIYLVNHPNITIKGFWPVEDTPPAEVIEASKKMPTYVVFYQSCPPCQGDQAPTTWPVREVLQVDKPGGKNTLTVYQLLPQ